MRKSIVNNKSKWYISGLILMISIVGITGWVWYNHSIKLAKNSFVARSLTSDAFEHGPIEFKGEVYFPSNYTFTEERNSDILGKLAPKNVSNLLLLMINHNIIADKQDENFTHLKLQGDDVRTYTKAEFLENPSLTKENFEQYSNFIICNDDNVNKFRSSISKDLLIQLEERFGQIKYKLDDFNKYDKLFYLHVDPPKIKSGRDILIGPNVYIGCIFLMGNKLYYGNMNNNIDGELYDDLMHIIIK